MRSGDKTFRRNRLGAKMIRISMGGAGKCNSDVLVTRKTRQEPVRKRGENLALKEDGGVSSNHRMLQLRVRAANTDANKRKDELVLIARVR